ncbi:MAG TPA: Ig-like domain-containing protein [Pedococcus sp.]|uniref:L,D-transpeptidase n=1 Tax=Pedococcus sp. TaxID=2860345 RepID=UPI002F93FD53
MTGVLAAVLVTAGCQGGASGAAGPAQTAGQSRSEAPAASATPEPAELSIAPAAEATGVLPSKPVVVSAVTGTLSTVTVTDADGGEVAGSKDSTGRWTSIQRLRPDTAYTVTARAFGVDGTPSTVTSSFRTLKPTVTATFGILSSGMTVGVGMPVSIQFDSAVTTEAMRAEVERRVSVTTEPQQAGAWGWLDNRQLMWRPADYWKPGTRVTVKAPLTGVQTGPDKWVGNDDEASFTVGSSMISTVDMKAHTMTVRRGGEVIRTIPVSTGKPGPLTETRYGTKVIIRKEGTVRMDSSTVGIPKGDPDYYNLETKWNLRVTWTGEYLHSAPWSVGSQGSANVSHGCVNMSPANAQWMFENSKVGDVVKFTGSNRAFQPHEGIGVWMYDFAGWKAQSALR